MTALIGTIASSGGTTDMVATKFIPLNGRTDIVTTEFIPLNGTNDFLS